MRLTENKKTSNSHAKINGISFLLFALFIALNTLTVSAQVTGISSGASFNWETSQSNVNDSAVLESIAINGRIYNTFVVPSSYNLVRVGPSGDSGNSIFLNGSQIVNGSDSSNWNDKALNAFQSMNLNHYFQSNNNGRNICEDQSALTTTDAQIQSITYSPGIPSNQNGVLAITERNANNCIHISVYGIPSGGSSVEELGATFIRPDSAKYGAYADTPPSNGSDYWLSNKVNENNGTIGIALFELSQLAPIGSTITEVRFTAATRDVADGKFFIMQEYAVDDIFDTPFNTAFNGDVGANDNVPNNSAYTYLPSTNPINGAVVVNLDGTFTYTPNSGFVGTDVFEVQVCLPAPNQSVCNTSTVTLTVNSDNLPTANNDSYTIEEDEVNNVFNVLDNDNFGMDGPAASNALIIATNASNGNAIVNDNGTPTNPLDDFINYTPNPYFNGNDSFSYQIEDGNGTLATATVNITVNNGNKSITLNSNNITVSEDAGVAVITVTINGNYQVPPTISYGTSNNTADGGQDYTNTSGTHTFSGNDGEEFDISIPITDDSIIEDTESFDVSVSSSSYNSPVNLAAAVSILDNDGGTGNGISVSGFTVNEDAGTADFVLELNANVQGGFSIDYAIADGTAIAGDDYTASANGTVNFTGNANEQHSITVTILDDSLIENSEDLAIALSNLSTNLIDILDANAVGTINDNDGGTGNGVQFDITNIDIDEDAGTVSLPVSLNANVQEELTVEFYTINGTAQDAADYNGVPQNTQILTFGGANNNNQNITIPIIDDIIIENTEDFQVILTNISTNLVTILSNDTANVNILDNDGNEGYPTDITLEACDIIPTAEVITVTSTCATTVNFNEVITGQNDGCAMDYTITRTWTFTDCISNIREHIQIVTIEDTQAPTFVETLPTDATVSCDNVPTAEVLTAIDGCDPNITVIFDEQITDNDSCGSNYIITRTWNATDCAGNPVNHTQVITVEDTTAPSFVEVLPGDITVSCDNVPVAEVLTAIDNCDTDITVIFDEQITDNDSCASNYTITRTWSTVDCAGNPVSHTQVITVEDTTAPSFVEALPEDVIVSCDNVPVAEVLTAIDNCDTDITVIFDEQITDTDSCGSDYIITRTWSTADCAGNPTTHVQTITVEDTTAPSFVEALPGDVTVSCDNVPVAEVLTAIDNCDTDITVIFDEQITDNDSCGSNYTITRTWNTADCAGNPAIYVQTIMVEDIDAPQFVETLPQNMTVMCNEVPDATVLTALDNCSTDISVNFEEIVTNDSNCATGYTVTRTWSTIDCAGNPNTHTQVITIAPTGPIMANDYEEEINLMCGDEIPEVPQLTFTGGCGNYQVEFTEETITLSDTEDFMITRTWNVVDSCGNTASFDQVIFVMQPQPEEVEINICVEDDAINLVNYLPESFDTNGVFELIDGNVSMEGSIFDPTNLEVGEYLISYSSTAGTCKYYVDFTIIVNSDCVPCGRDEIIVSNAVTANGDNINDIFTITGVEYCNYSFELMIFNRWGDKVFESLEYQNDWGGFAPNNAFGSSGMLPSGTYYYIINVKDTDIKPLNGYIYLGTGEN
ncbi:MAG: Calx-beta domain-containing protein [Flavobacteriaceae bacterium]